MNEFIRKINKFIANPKVRFSYLNFLGLYNHVPDKLFLKKAYRVNMGKKLDFENPKTFNEKLQWLKLYNRKQEYTMMVDKYKVRTYIAKQLGEEYLIPLLGVWDDPDEIEFDKLPNQFVLKCNHNSGLGMCICKDKSNLDIEKVKKELKKGLKQNYYLTSREWPYKEVPRKIICEKYMTDESGEELKDYKFYCFNGKVRVLGIYSDRNKNCPTKADYYDEHFQWLNLTWGYQHANARPEKPKKFDEMVEISEKLSQGMPEVRVDLYLCREKIYFGELTFFDGSGFDKIEPVKWDYKLGQWIDLPKKVERI